VKLWTNGANKEIDMMSNADTVVKADALSTYEDKQAEIKLLLKKIEAGLLKHDRDASSAGGHHWGHVGDLNQMVIELTDISDRLHKRGEYASA
jgi:hypothetical protein